MFAKFAYLRGHFQKQLRKVEKTLSRSGGITTQKWEYFSACTFLQLVYSTCTSEPSYQLPGPLNTTDVEVVYEGELEEILMEDAHTPSPSATSESWSSDTSDVIQNKIFETLSCVQDVMVKRNKVEPDRFDVATETIRSLMKFIPDSHQHIKEEVTEKILCLAADAVKKYNAEKNQEK